MAMMATDMVSAGGVSGVSFHLRKFARRPCSFNFLIIGSQSSELNQVTVP
jgi:hypothetical protein